MWLMQARPDGPGTVPVDVPGKPLAPGQRPADCCVALAWVRVMVPVNGRHLPLDFCAHHYRKHRRAIAAQCYPFDDQRRVLLERNAP